MKRSTDPTRKVSRQCLFDDTVEEPEVKSTLPPIPSPPPPSMPPPTTARQDLTLVLGNLITICRKQDSMKFSNEEVAASFRHLLKERQANSQVMSLVRVLASVV